MSEDNSYIAAGVQEDCEILLNAFLPKKSLRYDDFIETWKCMSFSLIYSGRKSLNEMIGFTDEVLQIAKRFMLPPHSFHMRAGGIYLTAGLYFKQPASGLVKIRLTYDDFEEMKAFIDLLREEEHFDVIYMFGLMYAEEAFLFTLSSGTYAVESYMREYTNHKLEDKVEESSDEEEFTGETFVTDFLKTTKMLDCIQDIDQRYYEMKKEIYGETSESLPKSLDFAFPNIIKALENVVQQLEAPSHEKVKKIDNKQKILKEFAFRKTSKTKKVISSTMEDINKISIDTEDSSPNKNQSGNSYGISKRKDKRNKSEEGRKGADISNEFFPTDHPKQQKKLRRHRITLETEQLQV